MGPAGTRVLLCLCVWALVATARGHAEASPSAASAPPTPLAHELAALASGDGAKVASAIDALGARGDIAAVAALTAFVRAGQADAWADRAIVALGATRSPAARDVLGDLTHHRRAHARALAYSGLARIPGAASDALLARGLRDSDAAVRGICASQLGERHATSALDVLLRALERGVPEAAAAVGKLGDAAALARYDALLGKLPLNVMLKGYGQFLKRTDLGEQDKLAIVARLGEVASVAVKQFLERQIAAQVDKGSPQLQHALRATAQRIDEHPTPAPRSTP